MNRRISSVKHDTRHSGSVSDNTDNVVGAGVAIPSMKVKSAMTLKETVDVMCEISAIMGKASGGGGDIQPDYLNGSYSWFIEGIVGNYHAVTLHIDRDKVSVEVTHLVPSNDAEVNRKLRLVAGYCNEADIAYTRSEQWRDSL